MPRTKIQFYCELDGSSPVLNWLEKVRRENQRAYRACSQRIDHLRRFGHELRRPHSDYLDEGIYELRVRVGRVHYRFLYFFHGQDIAVLAHGIIKEGKIPASDLARAQERKAKYLADPANHSHPR